MQGILGCHLTWGKEYKQLHSRSLQLVVLHHQFITIASRGHGASSCCCNCISGYQQANHFLGGQSHSAKSSSFPLSWAQYACCSPAHSGDQCLLLLKLGNLVVKDFQIKCWRRQLLHRIPCLLCGKVQCVDSFSSVFWGGWNSTACRTSSLHGCTWQEKRRVCSPRMDFLRVSDTLDRQRALARGCQSNRYDQAVKTSHMMH